MFDDLFSSPLFSGEPRDPARIRWFLDKLGDVWEQHSDERFGQFVMNLTRDRSGSFQDPWNWEEDEWLRALEERGRKT